MAEPKSDKERLEWFKTHHRLREAGWAAAFSHLDRDERQRFRVQLLEPGYAMPQGIEARFLPRWLDALAELDLLDDLQPNRAARSEARRLLERMARASGN